MPRMTLRHRDRWLPEVRREWGDRLGLSRREEWNGPSPQVLLAGAVVVGLGILAWTYLGPDLKRYLKIHSM